MRQPFKRRRNRGFRNPMASKIKKYVSRVRWGVLALLVLLLVCLSFLGEDSYDIRMQKKWEFDAISYLDEGADTLHSEFRDWNIGPFVIHHTYHVGYDNWPEYVQTMSFGNDMGIDISAQFIDKGKKPIVLLYQVHNELNVPNYSIYYRFGTLNGLTNDLSFNLITNHNGTVAGVTERSHPNKVLIVHDFSSNYFDWPGKSSPFNTRYPEFRQDTVKKAAALVQELAADNHQNLELGNLWTSFTERGSNLVDDADSGTNDQTHVSPAGFQIPTTNAVYLYLCDYPKFVTRTLSAERGNALLKLLDEGRSLRPWSGSGLPPQHLTVDVILTNGNVYPITFAGESIQLPNGNLEANGPAAKRVSQWVDDMDASVVLWLKSVPRPVRYEVGSLPDEGTLKGVSKLFYSDTNKWRKIYNANRMNIIDPNNLNGTTELIIPAD